jgi:hypothetical protein
MHSGGEVMADQEIPVPTAFTTPDGVQRVTAEEYLAVRRAYDQCRQDYENLRREVREGLRDRFAVAAMRELIARPGNGTVPQDAIAICAYQYADAMLAARERREGEE